MKSTHHLRASLALTFLTSILFLGTSYAIENTKIDRLVDISSQLVKITEKIYINGTTDTYIIKLEPTHKSRLAYIEATISGKSLTLDEKPDGSFEVNLAGQSTKQPLVIKSVYTRLLEAYPAEITQSERQLVRYQGLQSTLSPYLTRTVTTRIHLPPSSRLESFTKASKMTTSSNKLTYGPLKDIQPNQAESMTIHYENNTPFVAVTWLDRSIEISPWSRSTHIVNYVKISHVGAKLKGPFSRFEYQRDQTNGMSSVRNLMAELPKASGNIFFRDAIGNISTSNVRQSATKTVVGLKPRFPLFGGWVTDFNIGYSVPLSEFVNEPVSGTNYRLSIPLADVLFDNMFIEDALIKLYLPAGARNIEIVGQQSDIRRLPDEVSYSYLDVIGRPVISLKKNNIVANHLDGKPLVIRYDYSKTYMLQEPVLLILAVMAASLLLALISKLTSSSITAVATSHSAKESKPKSD